MCSATQEGLRVRRSKAPVRGRLSRASETGPGKPYCRIPLGSTGPTGRVVAGSDGACVGIGTDTGEGGGGLVAGAVMAGVGLDREE